MMSRPSATTRGDGGTTSYSYNDATLPLSTTLTASATPSLSVITKTLFDGLGRISQSQLLSDPEGINYVDRTYDTLGRLSTVSNSYRSTSDPTYGITTTQYDALSRIIKVIPPDGTSSTNNVSTSYSGNCTTVTDEAAKSRKSCTDALGRLTQAFEDPSGLNYETDYTYDVLNNLLTVNQKGGDPNSANWRTRTLTYDSLSRLASAANPESGTITYAYDNNGNLQTKVAPAPNQTGTATVTTTFTYDALNRLTQKSFSDGTTPTVKYGYDAVAPSGCTPPALTITNGVGRRTSMCDAAGAEAWSYDIMGRPLADQRTTNAVTKGTTYTYNLDGSVATLTYPSGRTVTYALASSGTNTAGRISSAVDSTGPINYATGALYSPVGGLSSLTNGTSIVSTFFYNDRLQPCRISVKFSGTVPASCADTTTGNVLDFTYSFGLGTSDNGNVTGVTNNRDTTRSQLFTYDALNRLLTAKTTSTSGGNCWDEQFGYDPWANLLSIARISGYTCTNEELLSVTATTKNQISSDSYDAAGNLITIPSIASYSYDAENHLKTAAGVTYTYDGDGRRVQKSNGKLYWYGMGSEPLDETDLSGNTNNSAFKEYIFFGGKRIASRDSTNAVNYFFADHLGSSRVVANSSGTVLDDSDFYPFGGERVVSSSSGNTYKFTDKERDSESGLDNLGARFFASNVGRFQNPDPLYLELHRVSDPQQLNLYAYSRNNPLKFSDPTGMTITCEGANCAGYLEALEHDLSFKIEYVKDKKGKQTIKATVDPNKKLTDPEKALLQAINDADHVVTIKAIGGEKDGTLWFARSDAPHKGMHTIAFDQTKLLDDPKNAGGVTSAQVVGHETLEGYYESLGRSTKQSHEDAIKAGFGAISEQPFSVAEIVGKTGSITDSVMAFHVSGSSVPQRIIFHLVTSEPEVDFKKDFGIGKSYPVVAYTKPEERKP
jgi:RHS repeat-associated protein